MIELLSPAGSMEALRAAIQNGADAVYLGVGILNARMSARNFSTEELREAVGYCHIRGAKVYLTMNTLVSDRELPQVVALIRTAVQLGIDAFIVQDLGVARLCRDIAPDVKLHASTQMSIHSLEGVLQAEKMGISRAVLSRELSRTELTHICKNSPIEVEVFVHGALCMCYSGQCYLSAVIGRRSGNRGQCAQPCRLPYGYGRPENRYLLSLRDNCLVEELRELRAMGVASLKIEGRMKHPEYVAIVTRIYRSVLESGMVDEESLRRLDAAFSRQGFTQGYYKGKKGREMFGVREDVREDKALLAEARATYEMGELPRVPIKLYAMIRAGEPAQLAAEDREGRISRVSGPVPQAALGRALTAQDLEARLRKTGGTPYAVTGVKSLIDDGLSLPASAVNALRRDALSVLSVLRGRVSRPTLGAELPMSQEVGEIGAPKLTVSVRLASQITKALRAALPAVLYIPLSELVAHPEVIASMSAKTELCVVPPRVIWDSERREVADALDTVFALGVRSALTGNLGQFSLLREKGFALRGDFGLNVFNSRTMDVLRSEGFGSATVSFESSLPQIRDMSKATSMEALIYGRLPLMLTENCMIKNRSGVCACDGAAVKLVDRKGAEFPIVRDCGTCRSVLLNGKKLYLLDKLEALRGLGLWAVRLQFTTENTGEVDMILKQYESGGQFDAGTCTRGLYLRGVE